MARFTLSLCNSPAALKAYVAIAVSPPHLAASLGPLPPSIFGLLPSSQFPSLFCWDLRNATALSIAASTCWGFTATRACADDIVTITMAAVAAIQFKHLCGRERLALRYIDVPLTSRNRIAEPRLT